MADILLEVTDLHKEFEDTVAVSGISFRIYKGESVGIVGESGCGKSTTARVVSGLEKPTAGKVLFQGKPYVLRPGKGRCAINMVFQDPIASFDSRMTVFASLYEALSHTKKISRQDAVPVIENALQTVELPVSYKDRRISQLSGGECQRIGIARAVLTEPELLICDEATSALDVSVQAQIIHLLSELKEKNHYTYLFISHDLALVASMCNRVLVMYRGKIVEEGAVESVIHNPIHPYTKLLLSCGDAFALDVNGQTTALPEVPEQDQAAIGACPFYAFCKERKVCCESVAPEMKDVKDGHRVACHLVDK